jgi:hypothetical protein
MKSTSSRSARLVVIASFVFAVALLLAPSTQAQQPDLFEVVVPIASLNQPVSDPASTGITTLKQLLYSMSAYANGSFCTRVDLASVTADVVVRLGTPGQPAACSTAGALVQFFDGHCREFNNTLTITIGTRQSFPNMAPKPPGTESALQRACVPTAPPIVFPTSTLPSPLLGGIAPPQSQGVRSAAPVLRPPDTGDAGLLR